MVHAPVAEEALDDHDAMASSSDVNGMVAAESEGVGASDEKPELLELSEVSAESDADSQIDVAISTPETTDATPTPEVASHEVADESSSERAAEREDASGFDNNSEAGILPVEDKVDTEAATDESGTVLDTDASSTDPTDTAVGPSSLDHSTETKSEESTDLEGGSAAEQTGANESTIHADLKHEPEESSPDTAAAGSNNEEGAAAVVETEKDADESEAPEKPEAVLTKDVAETNQVHETKDATDTVSEDEESASTEEAEDVPKEDVAEANKMPETKGTSETDSKAIIGKDGKVEKKRVAPFIAEMKNIFSKPGGTTTCFKAWKCVQPSKQVK